MRKVISLLPWKNLIPMASLKSGDGLNHCQHSTQDPKPFRQPQNTGTRSRTAYSWAPPTQSFAMCRHEGRPGEHAATPPAPPPGRKALSRFFFCKAACRPQGVGGIHKAHLQPASKVLGTQCQHDNRRDRAREERERQCTSIPHPFQTQHLTFAYQNVPMQ